MSAVTVLARIRQRTACVVIHDWLSSVTFISDSAPPDRSLGLLPCNCVFLGEAIFWAPWVCSLLLVLTLILTVLVQVHPEQEKPEPTPLVELEELSGSELTVFITPPEEPPVLEGSESAPQYW